MQQPKFQLYKYTDFTNSTNESGMTVASRADAAAVTHPLRDASGGWRN